MYNKDLTIFSVFHKDFPNPNCDFIKAIQVGTSLTNADLGFLKDNEGENISVKNPTHCELTALYWIWKNLDKIDSKYIGLCHYRRYFTLPLLKKGIFGIDKNDKRDTYIEQFDNQSLSKISSNQVLNSFLNTLNQGKLILPKAVLLEGLKDHHFNLKEHYIYNHIKEDWYNLEEAVHKICPDYYNLFQQYTNSTNKISCYNMFIGDRDFVKNYCDWLFPILEELENTVKPSEYPYQKRVFGFISERLVNLYAFKNQLNIAEYPVVFFE